jgi:hypothetical protein
MSTPNAFGANGLSVSIGKSTPIFTSPPYPSGASVVVVTGTVVVVTAGTVVVARGCDPAEVAVSPDDEVHAATRTTRLAARIDTHPIVSNAT